MSSSLLSVSMSSDSSSAGLFSFGAGSPSRPARPSPFGTSLFSGGVVDDSDKSAVPLKLESIFPAPTTGADYGKAVAPSCMFITSTENVREFCLGVIGSKGEKACTKGVMTGCASCATASHARKASYKADLAGKVYEKVRFPQEAPAGTYVIEVSSTGFTRHLRLVKQ